MSTNENAFHFMSIQLSIRFQFKDPSMHQFQFKI